MRLDVLADVLTSRPSPHRRDESHEAAERLFQLMRFGDPPQPPNAAQTATERPIWRPWTRRQETR